MKKYCLALILPLLNTAAFCQTKTKDYSDAFKLVDVWLDAQRDFDKLPSITATVIDNQTTLWSGAFGVANTENKVKATTSTLGSICSISKLFTSVAIMKLYDEGKLRLDDKISDLLPDYDLKQQFPESGPITVRTLLTHSSGLPREADYPYWTPPNFPFPSQKDVHSSLSNQTTLYPASSSFQYSNLGLTLLGEIVEKVSGISYDEYVTRNILNPLRLSDTRTALPEQLYGNQLAVGYSALSRDGSRQKVKLFQANGIKAAAGFSSNVHDLGKFASWQLRLRDTTTTEILKSSTLKYMHNVHWTNPDWNTTWGLGFVVYKGSNGSTWVGHGGSCPGYRSTLQIDLNNKRAYAIIINANGTNPAKYVNGIDGILSKVKKSTAHTASKRLELQKYVGYYNAMPWDSEEYISTWGDQLVLLGLPSNKPDRSMMFFKHIENDTFRRVKKSGELGETLVFNRDKNGTVVNYKRHGNFAEKITK